MSDVSSHKYHFMSFSLHLWHLCPCCFHTIGSVFYFLRLQVPYIPFPLLSKLQSSSVPLMDKNKMINFMMYLMMYVIGSQCFLWKWVLSRCWKISTNSSIQTHSIIEESLFILVQNTSSFSRFPFICNIFSLFESDIHYIEINCSKMWK